MVFHLFQGCNLETLFYMLIGRQNFNFQPCNFIYKVLKESEHATEFALEARRIGRKEKKSIQVK